MADTKISLLTANTTPLNGDYLVQVDDPTGTPTSKRQTIGDINIANAPVQGGLNNAYISRTVATNNLTVAIKTSAGADPSATDPVYIRIGNSVRTLTAALSVTMNAGTDTFGLGANGCLTNQDLFVYLGWRAAGSAIFIGVARYAHGITYADFSGTATNQGYLAYSGSAPASTDEVEVVGRVNVTNSGSASYNWSVPATSIVVSRPIFESRWLDYTPTLTGFSANPTSTVYRYRITYNNIWVSITQGSNGTSNGTGFTVSAPFTSATITNQVWRALGGAVVDNGSTTTTPGLATLGSASATINLYKDTSGAAWTAANGKRVAGFDLTFQVAA